MKKKILSVFLSLAMVAGVVLAPNGGLTFKSSAATTITLAKTATMGVGEVVEFAAKTNSKGKIAWKSDNTKVATVSKTGGVKAKSVGTATIRATVDKVSAELKVTVKKAPSTVKAKELSVAVGETAKLKVSLSSGSASKKKTFKSSNTKVAAVDENGNVKGIKKGTAKITVTTFNGKSATAKITVTVAPALGNGTRMVEYDGRVYFAFDTFVKLKDGSYSR
ncbi:MAG: Ig-like domain-containing protein, partial [Oscillospiraceae bacterium]|nr:Ig-like domain-containing protein [Oscillospiraceae bacterium]